MSAESPHWEQGVRCHGYWLGEERVGFVGLTPGGVSPVVYSWSCGGSKGEYLRLHRAKERVESTWKRQGEEAISGEEWRDIVGWEGWYQASSLGRIRSLERTVPDPQRKGRTMTWRGRVLKPAPAKGYPSVGLQRAGVVRQRTVHLLVCAAFHGPRPESEETIQCAHWDGNPENNRADNLRWATLTENEEDKRRHDTAPRGVSHHKTTLTEEQVIEIFYGDETQAQAGARYGIHPETVGKIRRGDRWGHLTDSLARRSQRSSVSR